jgi:hypothetical protein
MCQISQTGNNDAQPFGHMISLALTSREE